MKTLDSFSKTNSSLKTNFALMTFYNKRYSAWIERIILLFEHLQLMSQGLLLHASYSNDIQDYTGDSDFFSFVVYVFKLVDPSFLMPLQTHSSLSSVILIIVLCTMIAKYLLFGYILAAAYWNWKPPQMLVKVWRWTFKLQSRILCYFIASFWVNVVLGCAIGTFSIGGLPQSAIIGIASFFFVLEYIFSFALETQFSYVLPTQNFLASKDYKVEVGTLMQKFLFQIIQMACATNLGTAAWIFGAFNLTLSAIKCFYFYDILPLYNLQALLFKGDLLSIILSLNLSCFVHTIMKANSFEEATTNFIIMFWVVMAILMGKVGRDLMVNRILRLLLSPAEKTPESVVHKVSAVKQLRRIVQMPTESNMKYNKFYLLSLVLNENITEIFNLSLRSIAAQVPALTLNKNGDDIFQEYLTNMSAKFPGESLVNLYLAYLCSKKPSLYMKAIKISAGFKQGFWSQKYLSSTMLIYEIEKVKLTTQSQQDVTIDLLAYINSQVQVEDLRKNMLKETDLKITICNNVLSETPNVGQIYNCAQKVYKSKLHTQKKITQLFSTLPDSYIEPLLICARYHLVLDYAAEDYQKYSTLYLQKHTKYDKSYRELTFNKDNLYQDGNVFVIISGEKNTNGQIAFATHSIENLCGNNAASYKGSHISSLFTPSFQPIYNHILKRTFETGEIKLLENIEKAFICHKEGHIVETEFYLKVHPYISCGFYLDMIVRPVPSTTKEYLIVKEDGTIEGATKAISEALGIKITPHSSSVTYNVKQISEELWKMNQAFNIISKSRNKQASSEDKRYVKPRGHNFRDSFLATDEYKQALDIYSAYTSGGKIVQCMPLKQTLKRSKTNGGNDGYYFGCYVSVRTHEDIIVKVIALETADEEEDEQEQAVDQEKKLESENYEAKEDRENKEDNDRQSNKSENVDCQEYVDFMTDIYGGPFLSPTSGSNTGTIMRNQTRSLFNPWQSPTNKQNANTRANDTEFVTDNRMNTYGVLLSPTSSVGANFRQQMKNALSPRLLQQSQFESQHEITRKELLKDMKSSEESSVKGKGDFVSSQYLQQSIHDKVVYKGFKTALSQDFHPKSFNLLCLAFYGVILATLISQIIIRIISDNTMQNLSVKKDLLTYSQLTIYKMLLIDVNARGALNIIIDPTVNRGTADGGVQTAIPLIKGHLPDLKAYNEQVINGVQYLDESIKKKVFNQNVQLYGSYYDATNTEIRYVTNFGVVDSIADCLKKLFGLPKIDSDTSYPFLTYVIRNALNDFLSKTQDLKEAFIDSVSEEKQYLRSTIILCLIVTPMMLAGIVFTLAMIIWHQYRTEKNQMRAFVKLRPETIQDILRRLTDFKKKLDDREYIDKDGTLDIFASDSMHGSSYHKKHDNQKINYSETRIRYFSYIFKISFYIIILLVIMLWNYISALLSTNVIYRRQNQLEFANYISEIISKSFSANAEVFSSNNTYQVQHQLPFDFMNNAFVAITDLQAQLPSQFLEEDGTYFPTIENILFQENNCSDFNFTNKLYTYFCNLLVSNGQRVNLVSVLSYYRSLYASKIQDYLACNNSNISSLLVCAYKSNDQIMPSFSVAANEAQLIAQVVSNNIGENIKSLNSQRKMFVILFSVCLVIVGFLIWVQILSKLRNVHNDFKKVVQIFPPSLILSSFLLKSFLKSHSKEFENIKTDRNG